MRAPPPPRPPFQNPSARPLSRILDPPLNTYTREFTVFAIHVGVKGWQMKGITLGRDTTIFRPVTYVIFYAEIKSENLREYGDYIRRRKHCTNSVYM